MDGLVFLQINMVPESLTTHIEGKWPLPSMYVGISSEDQAA
jgi:hypothetical protein